MEYFKINDIDFSHCVSSLEVGTIHNYRSRVNAAGNTNVKYINKKKTLSVTIIPLSDTATATFLTELNKFQVKVDYLDPETKALKTITCINPKNSISYYTIREGNTMLKSYKIQFTEL